MLTRLPMTQRIPVGVFFALFTVSGFAGLIYESIWSHYLKLFLGHAAYAQTLVLAIFMGGMALGSWLVSRYTHRVRNLLMGYALAELGIGILAISFHAIFVAASDWSFETVLPALGNPGLITAYKWSLAAMLILPASVLLGSTFPLMSAGIMRAYPAETSSTLAWLYFTNSLGASAGVLASGFYLMERLGLPGTILTAGLLNCALAAVVWALSKRVGSIPAVPEPATTDGVRGRRIVLSIQILAFLTGAASFMYEIAWIRMLSMGLGASSHAFEVMLSAFILGMAIGGFVLAVRAPRGDRDLTWLSTVLVAKGILAVLAIGAYSLVLDLIAWLMAGLRGSDEGYALYNVSGHFVSMLLMFPAAFCAGMTLPLATAALIRRGGGEASIGRVYAANTAGCIVGAAFATHVGMEMLGVKGLTGLGAGFDIALGALVAIAASAGHVGRSVAVLSVIAIASAIAFASFPLDQLKMASGVFRHGTFLDPTTQKVEFYRDGKTATISVTSDGGLRSIRTNGKPDAGIQMDASRMPAADEGTMIVVGALPFAFKPGITTAANIGFGSGLTTATMLGSPTLKTMDTVEIEPAMVDGARVFMPRNSSAYDDPRSHIRIEDAKTFFASTQARYDVIVSEPSNPWVSGVATLFSDEFYSRIRRHLHDDGMLVQWLHYYETDLDLMGSILKALGNNFGDYVIYTPQSGDIVVLAVKQGRVPLPNDAVFRSPAMKASLERMGVRSMDELMLHRVASRRVIEPLFAQTRYPANSDYFPVVDLNAARARFRRESVSDLAEIPRSFVPFEALVDGDARIPLVSLVRERRFSSTRVEDALTAAAAADLFLTGSSQYASRLPRAARLQISLARSGLRQCDIEPALWVDSLEGTARAISQALRGQVIDRMFGDIAASECFKRLPEIERDRVALYRALALHDVKGMRQFSDKLATSQHRWLPEDLAVIALAGVSARVVEGDLEGARVLWSTARSQIPYRIANAVTTQIVVAHLPKAPPAGAPSK